MVISTSLYQQVRGIPNTKWEAYVFVIDVRSEMLPTQLLMYNLKKIPDH